MLLQPFVSSSTCSHFRKCGTSLQLRDFDNDGIESAKEASKDGSREGNDKEAQPKPTFQLEILYAAASAAPLSARNSVCVRLGCNMSGYTPYHDTVNEHSDNARNNLQKDKRKAAAVFVLHMFSFPCRVPPSSSPM